MQSLRSARLLVRLVLAWFALSVCAAIASPVVNPQQMELICSASGAMKLIVKTEGGAQEVRHHTLDCPVCVGTVAPPPAVTAEAAPQQQPLAYALQSIPAAHIAWLTAAPLPARGPPSA